MWNLSNPYVLDEEGFELLTTMLGSNFFSYLLKEEVYSYYYD
jgi:hypothetical protein